MRRHLIALFALMLIAGLTAGADADDKKAKKDAKSVSLFDGKSMDGWTFHLRDDKAKMEDVWSVKDGVMICKGKPVGYIRTKEKYTNYVLTLEWRFDPEKGAGNSGVLLRQVGEDKVWPKSIEAQLHSTNAGDFWNIGNFKMTAAKDRTKGRRTVKEHPTNEKPLGQWNQYEITVNGGDVILKVNGLVQNTASDCEEVAGHICLQSEGAEIHFRNIKLQPK